MPALTQGPLPARVYWVRRVMVLLTAVLLVFATARLLTDGSDASSRDDGAAQLSADTPSSTAPASSDTTTPEATPTPTPTPTPAAPVGKCRGSDIAVTPLIQKAVAGRDVHIVLQLRSTSVEACTWRVSPDALAVSITSGKDPIWNTRACRRAIAHRSVVVRQDVTTKVGVVWKKGKRSDEECSARTKWALPGWYHVTAAALGGEPSDVQFELTAPTAATVTVTASPKQQPTKKPSKKPTKKPSKKPSGSPAVD